MACISFSYETRNEAPDDALVKPTRIADEVLSFPVFSDHDEVVAAHQRLVTRAYLESDLLEEDVEKTDHEPAGDETCRHVDQHRSQVAA